MTANFLPAKPPSRLSPSSWKKTLPIYTTPTSSSALPRPPISKHGKRTGKLTEETCSYEWVSGLNADSPPHFILAFDKTSDHHTMGGPGRNAVFVDAHVEWILESEFQQRIQKQLAETDSSPAPPTPTGTTTPATSSAPPSAVGVLPLKGNARPQLDHFHRRLYKDVAQRLHTADANNSGRLPWT